MLKIALPPWINLCHLDEFVVGLFYKMKLEAYHANENK
jgi:hypothetical protein